MRPILTNSPGEVNALFIQPTKWCALNCKGCYVKAHDKIHQQVASETLVNLVSKMSDPNDSSCHANQITVAIDDLPQGVDARSIHYSSYMRRIFNGLWDIASHRVVGINYPELHITARSLGSLEKYKPSTAHHLVHSICSFDMVSLSTITEKDLAPLAPLTSAVKINYNHMLPHDLTSRTLNKYLEHMVRVGELVDSIYLVIFKRPLGEKMGHRGFQAAKARMRSDITVVNTLRRYLPKSIFAKINVDGCLQDAANFGQTGFGCSSNISRFQVWPDGTVSGCPYAKSGVGVPARGVEDILDNIRLAKESYDFKDKCYLPKVYDSLPRGPKDKGT